ncbi:hypothetical protein B8X02_06545 [Stenotrophomonas rhizophila]|nr:hypothetical protein B8X02_06545 [Stenotrophomonas rhizophila]
MSISDRNIWIPPVPALSDVGTYNAEGPANGGAFCLPGDKNRADSPPTAGPSASPGCAWIGPCSNSDP